MTRDEIIRMARDAGFPATKQLSGRIDIAGQSVARFARFAALIAAAEREAIADELEHGFVDGKGFHVLYANAIRESGNK